MRDRVFIDSNIWVYFATKNKSEKQLRSYKIIKDNYSEISVSTQVLGEIFNVLKKKTTLKSEEIAEIVIKYSDEFPVLAIDKKHLAKAIDIHLKYHYSYYDSQVIATALLSNCAILYSEDLHHQQVIEDKLTIINPYI